MLKRLLIIFALSLLFLGILCGAVIWWLVAIAPGEKISQANIERILAMESPVYYSDGQSKLGVFFQDAHRQYIPYEQIPEDFVNAIIAAEDNTFFQHNGVDYHGILRAIVQNIKAGRVVQGGSTITQQTAKNLFKRKKRSIVAKFKELIYAWRLEYHYPKEKIFEFYANQFYVSGNGHGLGVAARYYFDKSVSELNTLECSFIAGSVKRPNYYNPFVRRTEQDIENAIKRSKERVAYVLRQMRRAGSISSYDYQDYLDQEIPFKQGKMYYSLNTVMDLVKEALAEPEVGEALIQNGIDNIATSGIRVITTIDKDLQGKGIYSLRKELARLDVRLQGFDNRKLQDLYGSLPFAKGDELTKGGFLVGKIEAVETLPDPVVHVSFTQTEGDTDIAGHAGYIDERGLLNIAAPLVKYSKNRWSTAGSEDLPMILEQLIPGNLVFVSVRDMEKQTGDLILDLEKYPELQGALLVFKEGMIQTMVGGFENKFFNRAITARRSMGSVMKPLLYAAALQLGWNTMDILNNERNVFEYNGEAYFPRPDHISPYRGVAMSWAGVHSENVASVWLLYHLCDHLTKAQFKELITYLGLGQEADESYRQYKRKVRDEYGIVIDQQDLYEIAFKRALKEMEPDLIFDGKIDEFEVLRRLHYGAGFEKFYDEIDIELDESEDDENRGSFVKEAELREDILNKNYLRFHRFWQEILALRETVEREDLEFFSEASYHTNLYHDEDTGEFIYTDLLPKQGWERISQDDLKLFLESMDNEERVRFWNSIKLEEMLTAETMWALSEAVERNFSQFSKMPAYSGEVLYNVNDFRVLTALLFMTEFAKTLGIESQLDPVLSFPLGSNVVSLMEVARAYEGLATGKVFFKGRDYEPEPLAVIDRIENIDGEVIYSPQSIARNVLDPQNTLAVSDILRKVVRFGTGRFAYRNVRLHSQDRKKENYLRELALRVPLFGKTGTANRFTNATFAGIVPGVGSENSLALERGHVVCSYVGFDDNKPMEYNSSRITGAAGALPVWSRMANTILLKLNYADQLDIVDLSFVAVNELPLDYPDLGQIEVAVNASKDSGIMTIEALGGPYSMSSQATIVTYGEYLKGGRIKPTRFFRPFWKLKEY